MQAASGTGCSQEAEVERALPAGGLGQAGVSAGGGEGTVTCGGGQQGALTRARVSPVPEQPRASPLVPPTIEGAAEGPHLVKAVAGRPLALECVARGHPPPTLSWHHEGRPVGDSNGTWLEAGGSVLSLESLGEASGGRYSCVASSPAGEAVLQYAVDVQGEPRPVPPVTRALGPPPPHTHPRCTRPRSLLRAAPVNGQWGGHLSRTR